MNGDQHRNRASSAESDHGVARAVSPVVAVALFLVVVLALATLAGGMFLGLGESELTAAHSQGAFDADISADNERVLVESQAVIEQSGDTEFVLEVNGEEVNSWSGHESVELTCLYPGDHVQLFSKGEGSSILIDEYYFDSAAECDEFDTFPEKFEHVVVDGTPRAVNDEYAFDLSIVPNGDDVATDHTGSRDANIGNVSLTNEWHYVQLHHEEVEGLEPPVFVIVMVDNVHWEDAPHQDHHAAVSSGDYYNWSDAPPAGVTTGADSYEIDDGDLQPKTTTATEPTNDVFIVFKPGCDQSTLILSEVEAGYENDVYMGEERIVDDTSSASVPQTFPDAPAVECNGPAEW